MLADAKEKALDDKNEYALKGYVKFDIGIQSKDDRVFYIFLLMDYQFNYWIKIKRLYMK